MSSTGEFVDDLPAWRHTGERYNEWWDDKHGDGDGGSSGSRVEAGDLGGGEWQEELGLNVYSEQKWVMPGKGEEGPRCGEWQPDAVCSDCAEVGFTQHNCGRRECPECWGIWAKQSAMRVTRRVQEFRETQPDDWHRQVVHATVSPPEGSIQTFREFKEAWREAYQLAQEKGMRGGVVVPHPWRVCEGVREEYNSKDRDVGLWVWLREEYGDDWREAVYWSPHFHIIGFTTPDMEEGDTDRDDGWVWHVIRSLERYGGPRCKASTRDIYTGLRYLLSHTGFRVDESMTSVRYFGCLAPTCFTDDDKPKRGIQLAIEETVEAVAGELLDEDSDGDGDEDEEDRECPCEECDGTMIDVLEVNAYIRQAEPPPLVAHVMRTARDWRFGEIRPPPGLMRPRTEEDAQAALEEML